MLYILEGKKMRNALHWKYVLQYCSSGADEERCWAKIYWTHFWESRFWNKSSCKSSDRLQPFTSFWHDWVLQRKGARIFMILYKNNLCSLVWDGRTALDVRPFCVKICQLGLIFQFSILLVLEGSLSLAESIFLVLMSQWEMRRDNRVILVLWKLN